MRSPAATRLLVFCAGSWTKLAYRPSETLFTNQLSPTRPMSTFRSSPSKAAKAPIGSSGSSPRSRAKWFRVPKGMQTKGLSSSTATPATGAIEPSPPATPRGPGAARASASASSSSDRRRTSSPRSSAAAARSPADGLWSPERGLIRRKPLDSAFDGVQRPGGPDADEVAVRVGEVVDLRAEARSRDRPGDPVGLEPLDLALDLVGGELEADGAADFPPAVRIPREDEKGLLLEDEEGAVGVFALVVGRCGPVAEEPGVEVDRPVEVGDVEVHRRDEAGHATSPSARLRACARAPSSC